MSWFEELKTWTALLRCYQAECGSFADESPHQVQGHSWKILAPSRNNCSSLFSNFAPKAWMYCLCSRGSMRLEQQNHIQQTKRIGFSCPSMPWFEELLSVLCMVSTFVSDCHGCLCSLPYIPKSVLLRVWAVGKCIFRHCQQSLCKKLHTLMFLLLFLLKQR